MLQLMVQGMLGSTCTVSVREEEEEKEAMSRTDTERRNRKNTGKYKGHLNIIIQRREM